MANFCRDRMLDYHEMVEALKKDKFLSDMPQELAEAGELEVTDLPPMLSLTGGMKSGKVFIFEFKTPSKLLVNQTVIA